MYIARAFRSTVQKNVTGNSCRNFRISCSNYESTQATQPQIQEEKFDFEDLKVLERTERRKPPIESFMKNIFLSKFNRELLAYPEILNKEESEALQQRVERLEQIFSDKEKAVQDRENALKLSKLYAAPLSLTDNGLHFNVTERIRFLETISTDLNLAKQTSDHWIGLEILKVGLNPEDFQKLIPELSDGDIKISLCSKETVPVRISQPDFQTTAELDGSGVWSINGEKECYNTNDQYIIVLCSIEAGRLGAYLVHPNMPGVKRKGALVTFRQTPATPLPNLTQEKLSKIMSLTRLDTAVLSYSLLKQAILYGVQLVRGRFVSGKPLADIPSVRSRFADALLHLYACESCSYFTAGLLDGYADPDAELEVAMCRNFALSNGIECLLKLQSLPVLQQDEKMMDFINSMIKLGLDENDQNVNMFIALNGVQHAGMKMAGEIKKMRNPLFNPSFILKKVIADRFQDNDNPKLTLFLAEHLHPSMKQPAELLEYSVLRMRFACETIMARHAQEVHSAYTELERLSQAATEVLAMTACLARASRAYCIGLRNSEIEMKLAAAFTESSKSKVQQLILDIDQGEYLNLDFYKKEFGKKVLDTNSILVEKPTERVFW